MASVKKGTLKRPALFGKHLRDTKRRFWKSERRAAKRKGIADSHGLIVKETYRCGP